MGLSPLNEEFKVKGKKELLSETDLKGVITYANEHFVELSGYEESELVGRPHSLIRHKGMPQTVFKLLWDNLKAGNDYSAIVQNKRADGRYYWVYSEYQVLRNANKTVRGYRSKRFPIPAKVVEDVETVYAKLLDLEQTKSQHDAEMFLEIKLDNEGYKNYKEFVDDLFEKRFKGFGGMMSKFFG